jgi:hypothetical protein
MANRFEALGSLLCAAILVGCGQSEGSSADGGSGDDVTHVIWSGDAGGRCNAFSLPTCGSGLTCCFPGLSGTCTAFSACTSSVQFECHGAGHCDAGEVCCGSLPDSDASAAVEALLASTDAAMPDHWPAGVAASSFCASSCPAPRTPLCGTLGDCPVGTTCLPLPEGNVVLVAVGGETLGVCVGADASTAD